MTKQSQNTKEDQIKSSNIRLVTITLSGAALFFSLASFGLSGLNLLTNNVPSLISSFTDGNSYSFSDGESVSNVANTVATSVVSIVTETKSTDYFGRSTTSSAAGTGIIVTKDGYVLTNKHVIENAKTIQVVTDDGTSYSDVKLIGTDPLNDVAYLKINSNAEFSPASLGDSSTLSVGQQVIAIGNALGKFQNTVTKGIISGTGRSITATDSSTYKNENLSDMIQTDASINSGNSGGPLLNAGGQVIGINTAVSDGNGIGFAIPINSVKGTLESVIKTGKVARAYLGVSYVTITPDLAKEENLPVAFGAYVADIDGAVASGSPADKAGLKRKDIITAINDRTISSSNSLSTLIGEHAAGETVKVTYLRDGEEYNANITLSAYSNKED